MCLMSKQANLNKTFVWQLCDSMNLTQSILIGYSSKCYVSLKSHFDKKLSKNISLPHTHITRKKPCHLAEENVCHLVAFHNSLKCEWEETYYYLFIKLLKFVRGSKRSGEVGLAYISNLCFMQHTNQSCFVFTQSNTPCHSLTSSPASTGDWTCYNLPGHVWPCAWTTSPSISLFYLLLSHAARSHPRSLASRQTTFLSPPPMRPGREHP